MRDRSGPNSQAGEARALCLAELTGDDGAFRRDTT